jgi:6-phosphogluconolactonase (cycloisomerase 2 family)
MKLSLFGRWSMALFASMVLGLGMTACGGGTIGYMWVLGQQYNQIDGFKIDDYSGNLTEVIGAPFSSNGSVPVSLVVKSGGRYVYVINQGVCPPAGCGTGHNTSASVAVFSVGGAGTLTYQLSYQTQGYDSQWAQMDSSGTYLYVLDKYSPGPNNGPNTDGLGAITVFAADATTGRLTLVTNAQTKVGSVNLTYFEVGPSPSMMKTLAGCVYTLNNGNQTVSPYSVGTAGQLLNTTTDSIKLNTTNATSITGASSYIFLTDATQNRIFGFQSSGTCTLALLNGGTIENTVNTSNPMYTILDVSNRYLYVLNQSNGDTASTSQYSNISAFSLNTSNQEFKEISPGQTFPVGAGPVCIVEDPSSQYFYVSNHNDGTITGKSFSSQTGFLTQLKRGSTFTTVGQASCLAVSGSID